MRSYQLSKSTFMAGLQCPKRLWLQVHKPELVPELGENLPIIYGNEVGEMARRLYPGVLVEYGPGLGAAIEETRRLVADPDVRMIHEATFVHDGVLVRVDLLERTDSGWILTEVKGATSVKDYYIPDVAVQYWVLHGCGLKLDAARLMYVNNQFVYQEDGNYEGLLIAEDISGQVNELLASIPDQKEAFVAMLNADEPAIAMGAQCKNPYECEFCAYCSPDDLPEYPVSILPNLREPKRSQLMSAYGDVRDIPESELSNEKHLRIWRATCSGREYLDVAEAAVLKELPWPRYYLDFETIAPAVPRWKGMRPYMKAPFQWSCHIHHENGQLDHKEFLDVSGNDPRRVCAESLVEHLGNDGVVLVYNASFERGVIRDLADMYPDLHNELMGIHDRIEDLLPITRKAYYHPVQMGSWSIKDVVEALAPKLSYKGLEGVQHGGDAQLAWLLAIRAGLKEREDLASQLREYCERDTLAMVKVVDALLEKVG